MREHDYSRENIVSGIEQSLRRLRTDHIDLLQLHFGPTLEELERTGGFRQISDNESSASVAVTRDRERTAR